MRGDGQRPACCTVGVVRVVCWNVSVSSCFLLRCRRPYGDWVLLNCLQKKMAAWVAPPPPPSSGSARQRLSLTLTTAGATGGGAGLPLPCIWGPLRRQFDRLGIRQQRHRAAAAVTAAVTAAVSGHHRLAPRQKRTRRLKGSAKGCLIFLIA